MGFEDVYTNAEKKAANSELEKDKIVLGTDAYAVCELLDLLINKIERLRLSNIK